MNIRGYLSLWLRISLMINDVKYLAKCLLAIHMYSFRKCLFTSFAIFFVFLLLDCAKCAMISIQLFYFKYFISSVLEIFFWFFFLQFFILLLKFPISLIIMSTFTCKCLNRSHIVILKAHLPIPISRSALNLFILTNFSHDSSLIFLFLCMSSNYRCHLDIVNML